MTRTPQEYHQLADQMAEMGRGAIDALLEEDPKTVPHEDGMLAVGVANACAQLGSLYANLAFSPGLDFEGILPPPTE
jgi:hypothetical protein